MNKILLKEQKYRIYKYIIYINNKLSDWLIKILIIPKSGIKYLYNLSPNNPNPERENYLNNIYNDILEEYTYIEKSIKIKALKNSRFTLFYIILIHYTI